MHPKETCATQWDIYIPAWDHDILWAYHNIRTSAEKHSFLLHGFDYRHSTEAAVLPTKSVAPTNVLEQTVLYSSSAWELAYKVNTEAQTKQTIQHTSSPILRVGDWIFVYSLKTRLNICLFPQDETGNFTNYLDYGMEHVLHVMILMSLQSRSFLNIHQFRYINPEFLNVHHHF